MGIASAILFVINCSAFILYGVTALFGPIFIPLLMTKTFRAKFFHFLDVLVSFAMIRAVAAAFIFVWAGFMNAFLQQTFNGNYSMEMWLANLIPCIMVFIAFIINMLFIPSMTQAIFGGAAGLACAATGTVGAVGISLLGRSSGRGRRSVVMWDILLGYSAGRAIGASRLARIIRPALALVAIGVVIAGLIYACVVFKAVNERSHAPHVHAHSTH